MSEKNKLNLLVCCDMWAATRHYVTTMGDRWSDDSDDIGDYDEETAMAIKLLISLIDITTSRCEIILTLSFSQWI